MLTICITVSGNALLMTKDFRYPVSLLWSNFASKLELIFLNTLQSGEGKPLFVLGKMNLLMQMKVSCQILNQKAPEFPILSEIPESEIVPPSSTEEIVRLAEETLQAWERMRQGANKLMKMYPVRVCGYCPEVHVGPSGHKVQNCGAHKHQRRNGQHGWQRAVLDDLIPPRYVWHVPDINGPPMMREFRSFYGQAPAVVELCVQAGAAIPEQYAPTMRLDIGIPITIEEAEKVV